MGDEADHLNEQSDGFEGCDHRCRRCGAGPFRWEDTDDGWRLANEHGFIHSCSQPKRKKGGRRG